VNTKRNEHRPGLEERARAVHQGTQHQVRVASCIGCLEGKGLLSASPKQLLRHLQARHHPDPLHHRTPPWSCQLQQSRGARGDDVVGEYF
jgi:hypothetical protein